MGRRQAVNRLQQKVLPKRIALPVLSSDPLSSVAYASQEILVVLTLGGIGFLYLTPWVAAAVTAVLVLVVAGYRQLVRAYPSGGGEYEAAAANIGSWAGTVAAATALVTLPVTIAVAAAAAADNLVSAFPGWQEARLVIAISLVAVVAVVNIRGIRGARLSAVPAYTFVVVIIVMIGWGLLRTAFLDRPVAESADLDVAAELTDLGTLGIALLALRAVAAGSVLAAGIGTVTAGVPTLRKPRRKNAATTLAVMGLLALIMFGGITALAAIADVRYTADPCALVGFPCEQDLQRTVLAQVAAAVFGDVTVGFFLVQIATVAVLVLAAHSALQGFPAVASVLASDGLMPRQLRHRGDRLAFGNGVVAIALFAILLVTAFGSSVTDLVPLYVVVVFATFALALAGMGVRWSRQLGGRLRSDERAQAVRSRVLCWAGSVVSALVAVVAAAATLMSGTWIVLAAVLLVVLVMRATRSHYALVEAELATDPRTTPLLPSRVHAIVLVSKLHKPTMRALAYARSSRPDLLEAITVSVDLAESRALTDEWDRLAIPVPLRVLDSPYQELNGPVLDYVRSMRRASPRDLVVIYIPEYVLGHWWEQLLHNRSTLRLRTKLLFTPGVMVTSVPWQLHSSNQPE